jgi:hypothetical protein
MTCPVPPYTTSKYLVVAHLLLLIAEGKEDAGAGA